MDTKKLYDFTIQDLPDSVKAIREQRMDFTTSTSIVHSGLIAQEVEKAANACGFTSSIVDVPTDTNTVNYSLNYAEIVVPLIKAVQELSGTIDSLKSNQKTTDSLQTKTLDSLKNVVAGYETRFDTLETTISRCCSNKNDKTINQGNSNDNSGQNETLGIHNIELANSAVLYQNTPNPFGEGTTIKYFVPDNANAKIVFYDNYGNQIKTYNIAENGMGQLNVEASNLSAGMYSYSLIISGKIIDTKKMIRQ
jgi:hypothetical protein